MARRSKQAKLNNPSQQSRMNRLQMMAWADIKDEDWKGLLCQVKGCKKLAEDVYIAQFAVHPLCDSHFKLARAIILSPIKTKRGQVLTSNNNWDHGYPPNRTLAEWQARFKELRIQYPLFLYHKGSCTHEWQIAVRGINQAVMGFWKDFFGAFCHRPLESPPTFLLRFLRWTKR